MAQKVIGYIKLQIPAGKATPAPPVGPALGQHGVNIMAFTKDFNERTKNDIGMIIPVVITVYADHSFSFITKTPPAATLIKKECSLEKGSGIPNKMKVAAISEASLRKIAEMKEPDLNAGSVEAAMKIIAGTARSMGIVVEGTAEAENVQIVDAAQVAAQIAADQERAAAEEAAMAAETAAPAETTAEPEEAVESDGGDAE